MKRRYRSAKGISRVRTVGIKCLRFTKGGGDSPLSSILYIRLSVFESLPTIFRSLSTSINPLLLRLAIKMQIFDYAINLLCAPYAFPFSVQLFLGDIPTNVKSENYSSTQPWIGEQQVITARPLAGNEFYRVGGHGGTLSAGQTNLTSLAGNTTTAVPATSAATPLSDDYTEYGVRYSLPISKPLNQKLRPSPSTSLDNAICSFLAEKLNWVTVRPFVGIIHDAPIRLWVSRREVNRTPDGIVTFGKPEIVWIATRNKTGGLQPGELPKLEDGAE